MTSFSERSVALAAANRGATITIQSLPPALQSAVHALCEAYEILDLRIETTFAAAERDFLAAVPEVKKHETEIRQLVAVLIADLRQAVPAVPDQPVLLRFAYQDKEDLVEQLLPEGKARLVVMPVANDESVHLSIEGAKE